MPDQCDQGMLRDRQTLLLPSSDVRRGARLSWLEPVSCVRCRAPECPSSLLAVSAWASLSVVLTLARVTPPSPVTLVSTHRHETQSAGSKWRKLELSFAKFCFKQKYSYRRTVQQKCCLWQIGCSRLWLNRPHFKVGCNDSLAFLSSKSVCVLRA